MSEPGQPTVHLTFPSTPVGEHTLHLPIPDPTSQVIPGGKSLQGGGIQVRRRGKIPWGDMVLDYQV